MFITLGISCASVSLPRSNYHCDFYRHVIMHQPDLKWEETTSQHLFYSPHGTFQHWKFRSIYVSVPRQEIQEIWFQPLGREDSLEKEMATHSSTLAWRIPWTEETGRLKAMGHRESDMTEHESKHAWCTPFTPGCPHHPFPLLECKFHEGRQLVGLMQLHIL